MADAKIVAEYTVKVDKALKDLDKLAKRVDKVDDERKKTQQGFSKMSSSLSAGFKKLGGIIAATFAVDRIAQFTVETIKLAASAEGVERAFRRIGSPRLLQDLRTATRGTVNDLQLMQRAVQASNFKIPVENLASLFKFAAARARETGESVEYLTDSIVLGIGRKSPLILDNLGISAVELRKRLKGVGIEAANVGDIAEIIGEIATEELEKMGKQADTTADFIAQLETSWYNLRLEIGKTTNELLKQAGVINDETSLEQRIKQTYEYSLAVSNATNVIKGEYEVEQAAIKELQKTAEGREKSEQFAARQKEMRLKQLAELESELAELSSNETRKAEQLKLFFAEEQLDAAVGLNYYKKFAAEEEIANVKNEIKERVTQQGILEKQVDYLKEILGLKEDVDDDEPVNELTEAEKKLQAIRNMSFTEMKNFSIPVVQSMFDSLKGLNLLLDEQRQKLEEAPEFSKPYKDAQKAIEELEKKIDEFNDDYIDPSQGFPSFAPDGDMSATGQGLFSIDDDDEDGETAGAPDLEGIAESLNQAFTLWQDFFSAINQLQRQQTQFELSNLEAKLQAEEITREEYEQKRRELLRKQAAQEKSAAIIQATINTALAITSALNTQPFLPLGPIAAAIAGASGAAQIAAIAAQPLPTFAEGGFVMEHGEIKGRSHKQGGVLIEAEGGEFITSAKHAKQNADILKAINSGQWEKYKMENIIAPAINQVLEGGFENMGASYTLNAGFNDKNLLRAIDRHRNSDKDGFVYLAKELKKLKQPNRGGYSA